MLYTCFSSHHVQFRLKHWVNYLFCCGDLYSVHCWWKAVQERLAPQSKQNSLGVLGKVNEIVQIVITFNWKISVFGTSNSLMAGAIPPTLPGPGMFPATAAACAATAACAVAACCCICLWHWRRSNTWGNKLLLVHKHLLIQIFQSLSTTLCLTFWNNFKKSCLAQSCSPGFDAWFNCKKKSSAKEWCH